jgi:hypothetical protein
MSNRLLYLVSLPERLPRAAAASAGGLVYETTRVLLPEWARNMQIYQALLGRGLRIIVEWAGGVDGVMPPAPVTAGKLAARKLAGNAVEFTSILLVGWSPLWWLAAATDITGGTQVYLHSVADELKRLRLLPSDQELTSADGLLDALQGTTAVLSKAIDIPPLDQAEVDVSVAEMRDAWQALRANAPGLPTSEGLKAVATEMQETAEREETSVWVVSTMIGLAAVGAGVKLGQANIADFYRASLAQIRSGGLSAYYDRVSRPYVTMAANHLDPQQESHTERLLRQVRLPRLTLAFPARAKS